MLALLVLLVVFAVDFVFVLLVLHAVVMLTNIYLQNLASIQKRTGPVKFAHLAEKSGKGSISNLSTKVPAAASSAVSVGVRAAGLGDLRAAADVCSGAGRDSPQRWQRAHIRHGAVPD